VTQRLPPERLLAVVRDSPMASVDLVVRNPAGEVLLGRRTNRPAQGTWFVPGGRVLKGERLTEAFARIAREELGRSMELEAATPLGVYEHFYDDNFAGVPALGTHYIALAYAVESALELTRLPDAQHTAYRWLSEPALLADPEVHAHTKAYFR
jgi:colanic acid biosynthesis protein WcaH